MASSPLPAMSLQKRTQRVQEMQRFPHGLMCFGATTFDATGASFCAALERLCARVGAPALGAQDAIQVARGLELTVLKPGELQVLAPGGTRTLRHPAATESLVSSLQSVTRCDQIAATQASAPQAFDLLNMLVDSGVLQVGPAHLQYSLPDGVSHMAQAGREAEGLIS